MLAKADDDDSKKYLAEVSFPLDFYRPNTRPAAQGSRRSSR
jgi:hypothetical protein